MNTATIWTCVAFCVGIGAVFGGLMWLPVAGVALAATSATVVINASRK